MLWLLPVALIAAFVGRSVFLDPGRVIGDGHSLASLELAINAQLCRKPGHVSDTYRLAQAISENSRLNGVPFRHLAASAAGSVDAYCATVVLPFLNNENSLMLLMRLGAAVRPGLTPRDLARYLGWMRFIFVLVFAYALVRGGFAWPLTIVAVLVVSHILHDLRAFKFSMYTFFIPLLLFMAGSYTLALFRDGRRTTWTAAAFVIAGMVTAFCANMRSSHLPLYLAMFLVFAATVRTRMANPPRVWLHATAAVLCFAVGYALFLRLFISPIVPTGVAARQNRSYHVIAHPLVLGLAVPESDFSRRHGIQWLDERGIRLAQQLVPDATYLGPGYEAGLFLFYARLWLMYPGEMRQVYSAKFGLAGTGMFARPGSEMEKEEIARALSALGTIDDGRILLALYVAAAGAAAWRYRRTGQPRALLVGLLFSTAALMYIESAVIFSTFSLQYYGFLLFATCFLVALVAQGGIDAAVRVRRTPSGRVSRLPPGGRKGAQVEVNGGATPIRAPDDASNLRRL